MKKIIYMILILTGIMATSITMTACSNPVKAQELELREELVRVNQENQALKEENQQLQQSNQELDDEIAKLKLARPETDANSETKEEVVFNIYGANVDTYKKELLKEITLEDSLTLEEKLTMIAEELSQLQFEGIGIEVAKIEEQDGKKIATVNLTEVSDPGEANWKSGYFQGSTGGIITTVSLEETFLQRDYQGEWIDGVKFLYEGQEIQFDHVESLREISYR